MSGINSFTLAGFFCFLIGSLILAGFTSAVKDAEKENAVLRLGGDPYIKKNQIIREYEKKAGILFIVAGAILQIGGFLTGKVTLSGYDLIVGVIVGVTITVVGLLWIPPLTYRVSFPKITAYFTDKYRETFEQLETAFKNGDKTVDMTTLDTIGDMLDSPRVEGGSDKEYLERLRPFFVEVMATNQDNKK